MVAHKRVLGKHWCVQQMSMLGCPYVLWHARLFMYAVACLAVHIRRWPSVGGLIRPVVQMHQVASSACCLERSQIRVLLMSDRVTGNALFHAECMKLPDRALFVSHVLNGHLGLDMVAWSHVMSWNADGSTICAECLPVAGGVSKIENDMCCERASLAICVMSMPAWPYVL